MKTKLIYVEVVKGNDSKATTQTDLVKQLEEQVFIKAVPSTNDARIGEQILLDYKVYTTRGIESYNLVAESDYPGFFAQDIRLFDGRVIKEVIDGVQYSTKILKRVALFPQQAGLLRIDPMIMELAIAVEKDQPRRRRSFFYTPLLTRFNVETDSLKINVLPLPAKAPLTFSGAIGKYKMTSSINRNKMTTDDAISIQMTLSGNGDMKQVQAPVLMVSDSFELYDPKILNEKTIESGGMLVGSKTIQYSLLPRFLGAYKIQPAFTYFDTDSVAYVTLKSSPFSVVVSQGKNTRIRQTPLEEEGVMDGEIRNIHSGTKLNQRDVYFAGSGLFWGLLILPFLFLGGIIVSKQVQASRGPIDRDLLRRRQAQKVAQEKLTSAKVFLDQQNSRSFYDEISKGLLGYVGDKFNIPLSEMGRDNIHQHLESLAVSEAIVERFMEVLKTCEMALFAGMDNNAAMQKSYDTALAVVVEVEEELAQKK